MHFLGLPITPGAQGENTIPVEFNQQVTITLPEMINEGENQKIAAEANPIVHMKHTAAEGTQMSKPDNSKVEAETVRNGDSSDEGEEEENKDDQLDNAGDSILPTVRVDGSSRELGGSVRILGPNGNPLNLDPDTGELLTEESATAVTVEDLVSDIQSENKRKLRNSDSEEGRKAKSNTVQDLPSQSEIDEHMLTHVPFRSWCRVFA